MRTSGSRITALVAEDFKLEQTFIKESHNSACLITHPKRAHMNVEPDSRQKFTVLFFPPVFLAEEKFKRDSGTIILRGRIQRQSYSVHAEISRLFAEV